MEMSHEFEVSSPLAETWAVLTDIERIAPCMPGAELRGIEDDEFRGVVKVKLGAITAEYRGAARFVEKDDTAHRAVLRAEGREARGQGSAAATITARLAPRGSGTKVSVVTDLQITGRVAQFGRGVLAEVSGMLLGQFVDNLETTVLKDGPNSHESEVGGSSSARTSEDSDAWRAAAGRPGGLSHRGRPRSVLGRRTSTGRAGGPLRGRARTDRAARPPRSRRPGSGRDRSGDHPARSRTRRF